MNKTQTSPPHFKHRLKSDIGGVVVNWNTSEHLQKCLTSFLGEGVDSRNIVVVDQGSIDDSVVRTRQLFAEVRIIETNNEGYAHAVNLGAAKLKTPFVAAANADIVLGKESLMRLLQQMDEDEQIGLLGCRTLDSKGKNVTRFSRTSILRSILLELAPRRLRGTWRDSEHILRQNGRVEDVAYVEGAFLFFRKDAYLAVAGMDEGFSFFYEDADLPLRMLKAGYRVRHVPNVHVTHVGGASFAQAPLRHAEEFHKNLVRLYQRHALRRSLWLRNVLRAIVGVKEHVLELLGRLSIAGHKDAFAYRVKRNRLIRESLKRNSLNGQHAGRESPLVSVIVPTRNRLRLLMRFIQALTEQSYQRFEVIVVDQSDSKDTIEQTEKIGVKPVVWLHSGFKNRSLAKNVAIAAATGDLLLFCDDDIVPSPQLIEVHVRAHREQGVGAVSCRVMEEGLPAIRTNSICKVTFYGEVVDNFQSDTKCYVETLVGGNMSIKRDVQREVGYFDSLYRGSSIFEEPDYSTRIRHLGYKILFTNETSVLHEPQQDGNVGLRKKYPVQYYRDFHHNEIVYFLKNRNRLTLPLVVSFCLLRSIKQTKLFRLPLRDAVTMFGGVFEGFRSYYHSLR